MTSGTFRPGLRRPWWLAAGAPGATYPTGGTGNTMRIPSLLLGAGGFVLCLATGAAWFSDPSQLGAQNMLLMGVATLGGLLVFRRTDSGDTGPVRQISGPSTGLCNPIGLVVDSVADIYSIDLSLIEPTPDAWPVDHAACFVGVVRVAEGLMGLLDLSRVVTTI